MRIFLLPSQDGTFFFFFGEIVRTRRICSEICPSHINYVLFSSSRSISLSFFAVELAIKSHDIIFEG